MSKPAMIRAAELVEDFDLYPRPDVDSQHVSQMVEALEAGVELPAAIADRKSKRIVDGFHRKRAWIRWGGPDVEVPVIWKDYKNDGELFLDAMACNSGHGRRLSTFDKVRCAVIAGNLKLEPARVAAALKLTTERVSGLIISRTATGTLSGRYSRTAAGEKGDVPLKRTIAHMAGGKINKQQQEANDKLSGMAPLFYINQVIILIEANLLPEGDENLETGLKKLHDLLEARMVAV